MQAPIEMSDLELNNILDLTISMSKDTPVSKDFCRFIREKLDRVYGPAWHVIVGKNFGCYAVHDKNKFVKFKYKENTYLIYKTTI